MNPLIEYWPNVDQVAECLRTEAETVDQALLLAVHLPITLKRRSAQAGVEEDATEGDLLTALLRPVKDGSSVVVAVTGASGVGKSHMVRWLGAQLDRHPQRSNMVVVSIPKTASLRRVVELILEPLSGTEYSALKKDLGRAVESLDPPRAAELLATALAEELGAYAEKKQEEAREKRDLSQGPRIRAAQCLRDLMRDPDIRDLWFRNVLLRIVAATIGGTAEPAHRQFQASDFEVPEAVASTDLRGVANQALAFLASSNGVHRPTAAEVLQEVLDPALRTIFRFTEALQQRTIQEVVDDIRRQLLADGKELVLLIEDLAALSGIQQPLLDIMIAESDEKGVRVRAPIRTAVAVTDGFLAGRQTVLTRAREQWVVPSDGIDEAAISRLLVELTGRYLNAARFGVSHLKKEFETAALDLHNLYVWVPKFAPLLDAKSSDALDAFGRSESGYSLFPFNAAAVRSLAATVLKVGSAWTFNPRAFINEVLSKTLNQRFAFEEGAFPPPNFRSPRLLAEVSVSLQHQGLSPALQGRVASALFHWGGNPQSLTVVPPVPREVFEAFSVPWPFEAGAHKPVVRPEKVVAGESGATTTATPAGNQNPGASGDGVVRPVTPAEPMVEVAASAYALALEAWTHDTRLTHEVSRRTRVLLAAALTQRLDFDDWCLHGQKVETGWFWVPPASNVGNPTGGPMIQISPPDTPVSPRVIAGLKALDRWDSNSRSWDYSSAENDYAAANTLLEDLEGNALDLVLGEVIRDAGIATLALHRQDLLLGVTNRPENPGLKDLLAAAPVDVSVSEDALDTAGRRALERRRRVMGGRTELQQRLKNYLACYQGNSGRTMLAIDIERFRQACKLEAPDKWVFGLNDSGRKDSEELRDTLDRLAPQSIDMLLRDLGAAVDQYLPAAVDAFGEDHARVAWREEMRGVVDRAIQESVFPTDAASASEVRGAIDRLSVDTVETTIQRLRRMRAAEESTEVHRRLLALSAVPLPQLIAFHKDVSLLQRFLAGLNQRIRMQTNSIDDQTAIQAHEALVKALAWEE
ncbi:protein DpdH [Cupriavidus sp. Marseille-Q8015]